MKRKPDENKMITLPSVGWLNYKYILKNLPEFAYHKSVSSQQNHGAFCISSIFR
ncbi:MAG: hypothetical protein ACFFG0_14570 [Candidatus Thorarchaeota archaeon]